MCQPPEESRRAILLRRNCANASRSDYDTANISPTATANAARRLPTPTPTPSPRTLEEAMAAKSNQGTLDAGGRRLLQSTAMILLAVKGGELGWFAKGAMVAEFGRAFSLSPNDQ